METAKKSLFRLILGIWIVAVPITAAGIIITAGISETMWTGLGIYRNCPPPGPLGFLWGDLIGSIVATGFAFHIYHTLDIALDLDSGHAAARARQGSMLRSMITIGVLIASLYFKQWINIVGVLFGILGLKLSVYLQPLLEKISVKLTKDRKE